MLKKLIATIATTICCLADPLPANAQNSFEDHNELWEAIQSVGVVTLVNHPIHCKDRTFAGIYYDNAMLVICQDNREANNGVQVEWTDNDLDTLRHEAHHIVQDCAVGTVGDYRMERMFADDNEFFSFISKSSYGEENLIKLYTKLRENLNDEQALIEVEAYVIAKDIPAKSITKKLLEFCNNE